MPEPLFDRVAETPAQMFPVNFEKFLGTQFCYRTPLVAASAFLK